ncbi:MAG: PHP domain-containing protein [Pseudomonadota bacterium]|nr:phosphatase [Gammaproteobacteria bacterium]MBJ56198.1 phosphatase [Gammaproteobacteria bacterium]MEC8859181.1 PHP domain-containing protein [Pseudomonadota bacterium]HBN15445.1 phosphatase [Pseudohongiella sp.]|tara:strand:- start:567 stop:1433 length:867 start_codon:yes stop_codon:yes gene_type:complete
MIDLHSHTRFSDGHLDTAALLQRASSLGIQQLAITDHDCVDAHLQIASGAVDVPDQLDIIPGTEISTRWDNQEVHVLGLMVDINNATLSELLAQQQQRRQERAAKIGIQLERAGHCGLQTWLQSLGCTAVSRVHVAEFLVQQGVVKSKQQAFSKYLARRGRAYVPAEWCSISEAVEAIQAAGGVAALAHPDRYPLSRPKFRRLIDEFVDAGGDALEVSYSNLNQDMLKNLSVIAAERKLWATVGSDFHSPKHTWMDLGKIRRLPEICRDQGIWRHPKWTQFARPVTED